MASGTLFSNLLLFTIFTLYIQSSASNVPKSKVVKCAVCRSLVHEIKKAIREVDPQKTIEVGSFRINPDGKQKRSTKKYAGSETHMNDLTESICEEFKDYAQAKHKSSNKIEVIKLVEDGKMNPSFNEYEMIQDPDLNKGVQYHCESIVEDFEDDIIRYFPLNVHQKEDDSTEAFCTQETKICKGVREEL